MGTLCAAAAPRYQIEYATYLGGTAWDEAREVIVFPDGSVLVGAQSSSAEMPTTPGVIQPRYAGDDPALGHGGIYGGDCYLARLSPDGRRILAATYFGGSKQERNVYGMGLDRDGNIVISTATRSADAPTTPGCFQPKFGGGPSDMLVAKISPDLKKLIWCTYIGGSGDDFPRGGLAVDGDGCVIVVGTSASADFPTTPGAYQPKRNGPRDSAIVKLKPDGSGLVFSTLLGGTGEDDAIMGVRVDDAGNLHFAGHTKSSDFPATAGAAQAALGGESDVYFAALSADGSRLLHATYLGGSGNEFAEHRPWLCPDGGILLAGFCGSDDFPTTEGAFQRRLNGKGDGFLTKLSSDGKRWVFSTLLGGSQGENWLMPTVDAEGDIFIVGNTGSRDFPVTPDALQSKHGGGTEDAALAILSGDGSKLLFATYLGGGGEEMIRSIALGPEGEVYLVGHTSSEDFPVTPGAVQSKNRGKGDAFVVKLVRRGSELPAIPPKFTDGVPYLGTHETGLYPGGKNEIPEAHRKAGERIAASIRPLDADGKPDDARGRIVALVIGHSNCQMYFTALDRQLQVEAERLHPRFVLVNAAVGGQQLPEIHQLRGGVWDRAQQMLRKRECSPREVQVLFLHTTYHPWSNRRESPPGPFPETMERMRRDLAEVLAHCTKTFPNLKIAYLTADGLRRFTGFEPHVWQEAFGIKWLIASQIRGDEDTTFEARDGRPRRLPWLQWGPYIWDGSWDRSYFTDGVHPSRKALDIFVERYWSFLQKDPVSRAWLFRQAAAARCGESTLR